MLLKSFLCLLFLVAINANYYTIDADFNVRRIPEELVEYYNQQDNILATTQFIDDRNNSGWTYYTAQSNGNYADWIQTYSVGYMEGYLAWEVIWGNYNNKRVSSNAKGLIDIPADVTDFIHNQTKWMVGQIAENLGDNYWSLVNATLALQVGLYDGYIVAITKNARLDLMITFDQFYLMSYWTDLGDVVSKFSDVDLHMPRCSFLLKLVNNNESLIGSHVTWTDYTDMLRTYKVYTLNLRNPLINTKRMSFSSAPGQVPSIDDYYILDNGRVVTETTIGNHNPAVYDWIHYDSIPYWVRITVTNLAYTDQESWANLFYTYRSGTYNNNWIVIDFKQFNATKANLANATNIVWYIEEFYSLVSARDVTQELLVAQGYAASYNVPYNATLQVLSQDPTNYTSDDRYFLFKKYAPGITDLSDFQHVMRMNNISDTQDYCEAIASRCDLNQSTTLPWGAVDCKLTTDYWVDDHQGWIINGPTAELEAPFSWGNWPQYHKNISQMPEVFNYNWTFIDPANNFTVIPAVVDPVVISKMMEELIQ